MKLALSIILFALPALAQVNDNLDVRKRYLLYDDYSTALAAGAVNGTYPTRMNAGPVGGLRTVIDTENKLSITDRSLSLISGKTVASWADPMVYYGGVERTPGRALLLSMILPSVNGALEIGWGQSAGSALNTGGSAYLSASGGSLKYDCGSPLVAVGNYLAGNQAGAVVLRKPGSFMLGSPGWTLYYLSTADSTATLYPSLWNSSKINTLITSLRVPQGLWLPNPLVSDSFTRANGALGITDGIGHQEQNGGAGLAWAGSTWGILSNKATNAPEVGLELLANNGFTADANWSKGTGWSIDTGAGVAVKTAGTGAAISQALADNWYRLSWQLVSRTAGYAYAVVRGTWIAPQTAPGTYTVTMRGTTSATGVVADAAFAGTVDNVYCQQLNLTNLISAITNLATPNVLIESCFARGAVGFQAGLVANLDTSSYTNFILAYYDGNGAVTLDACVNGNYTNYITAGGTYGDNKRMVLVSAPAEGQIRLYYNDALVGAKTSDVWPGFTNFTACGLFSTSTNASFTNFVCWPRGAEGQYGGLDRL